MLSLRTTLATGLDNLGAQPWIEIAMLYILKSSLHIESSENVIYMNLVTPWARRDIPLRFSIPLQL